MCQLTKRKSMREFATLPIVNHKNSEPMESEHHYKITLLNFQKQYHHYQQRTQERIK